MTKSMLKEVNVGIQNRCSRLVGKDMASLFFLQTCSNEFANRSAQFWLPNMRK